MEYPLLSPLKTGLLCRCPRCGRGRVFHGFLDVAPSCPVCGLDLAKVDTGDGPAVFIMFVVGFLVVGLALVVQVRYDPPYWLQLTIWLPAILGLSLGLLRPFKSILLSLQYRHRAAEGRLDE